MNFENFNYCLFNVRAVIFKNYILPKTDNFLHGRWDVFSSLLFIN